MLFDCRAARLPCCSTAVLPDYCADGLLCCVTVVVVSFCVQEETEEPDEEEDAQDETEATDDDIITDMLSQSLNPLVEYDVDHTNDTTLREYPDCQVGWRERDKVGNYNDLVPHDASAGDDRAAADRLDWAVSLL